MAAIDKIYVSHFQDFDDFRKWVMIYNPKMSRYFYNYFMSESEFDKWYCAPYEVENISVEVNTESATSIMEYYGKQGYELVQVMFPYGYKNRTTLFFFTRKKIKNYYEEA